VAQSLTNRRKEQAAAVGVADHNGWAVLVCVAMRSGVPVVLVHRRVRLIEEGLPTQPYHHETLSMSPQDAEELVRKVRESAYRRAYFALASLQSDVRPEHRISSLGIRQPSIPALPETVAEAHASPSLLVAADGMIYHDAICAAARALRWSVVLHAPGDEMSEADLAMGRRSGWAAKLLKTVERSPSRPWTSERRSAAAAALATLPRRPHAPRRARSARHPAAGRSPPS
jgi:hypothetical protein